MGRSYDLIIFDEAALADGRDAFNVALRPTLDKDNSKAIFISTPRGSNNWFYELFEREFTDYFIAASHNSNVTLENASFKYLNSPLDFTIASTDCIFNNNIITINKSQLKISKSDLSFSGELKDFIPYIFERKKKMNILICSEFFHPSVGGAQKVAFELSTNLKKMGHRVHVATSRIDSKQKKYERKFDILINISGIQIRTPL